MPVTRLTHGGQQRRNWPCSWGPPNGLRRDGRLETFERPNLAHEGKAPASTPLPADITKIERLIKSDCFHGDREASDAGPGPSRSHMPQPLDALRSLAIRAAEVSVYSCFVYAWRCRRVAFRTRARTNRRRRCLGPRAHRRDAHGVGGSAALRHRRDCRCALARRRRLHGLSAYEGANELYQFAKGAITASAMQRSTNSAAFAKRDDPGHHRDLRSPDAPKAPEPLSKGHLRVS
jgi:hypothetical protein